MQFKAYTEIKQILINLILDSISFIRSLSIDEFICQQYFFTKILIIDEEKGN